MESQRRDRPPDARSNTVKKPRRFHLVSLGCPKNLVDSSGIAALLTAAGYTPSDSPAQADLLIVNTCGFIAPAREESLATLRQLAQAKKPRQRLVAAGCYAQRAPAALIEAVPGLDGLIGTRCWQEITTLARRLEEGDAPTPVCHLPETRRLEHEAPGVPRATMQGASAYLKIADGCRHACAFCAIPLIKGPSVSRRPEAVVADARWLAERGAQEIVLIAQDTTDYGHDLGMRDGLAHLLERLVEAAPQTPWIRLMYAHPSRITDRLIETMARHAQILPYLDLPLQHAHPDVLRRMRRPADITRVLRLIARLRAAMPEIALRTTFLVGFPGETEAEFQALVDLIAEVAFDRVGVFVYSHEQGTPAAALPDDIPAEVKEERRKRLMEVQQSISLSKNQALIGRVLDVLIEGEGEGLSVGRSYRDAPEIDGLVLVRAALPIGAIAPVRITDALEYDLIGAPARA